LHEEKPQISIQLHKPSANEILFFFLCGAITSVPLTLFIDQYASRLLVGISPFYATFLSIALFAPFIEEFSKIFPLYYRHGETQRSIFSLALVVGLGFGIVEFITYVGLGVNPLVRIPGLLFHPANTSIAAYGIATKKPIRFYLAAVLLHMTYNAFTIIELPVQIPVFVLAITIYLSWKLHAKTKEEFIE
jgi:RsiW-degrading membrane proteinase PrsW (M82 family)